MIDLRSSGRIFKRVKRSGLLTDLSHDLHACGNVLMHIDMFVQWDVDKPRIR